MKAFWFIASGMLFGTAVVLFMAVSVSAEPSTDGANRSNGNQPAVTNAKVDDKDRVSVAIAKDRVKLMHDIFASTLHVMHRRYFSGVRDRTVIPARAMEDIFADLKRDSDIEARWISVNLKAMSLDHEPRTDFELKAVTEISAGKSEIEVVEDGYYRRASAVPLTSGCISCHGGFFREQGKTPRFAALVISVPVTSEPQNTN